MTLTIEELEEYPEITKATFDHENAHLAVTHCLQGGAANGWNNALLLKSDDTDIELSKALEQVSVKMSMEDFLNRFFHMYSMDAEILTKLLGYETEEEYRIRLDKEMGVEEVETQSYEDWYEDWITEKTSKIELLEKAKKDFLSLDSKEKIKLLNIQKSLEEGLENLQTNVEKAASTLEKNSTESVTLEANSEESGEISSAIGSDNLNKEINKSEGENISMTKKVEDAVDTKTTAELELELEKAQLKLAELDKAQEKIAEIEKAAKEKEAELEKAKEKLVELEKAENQRIEKGYGNFAETLSFVEEKEDLVSFLMKARETDTEGAAKFIEYLEKAAEAIKAATSEVGFEGADETDVDLAKSAHKTLDAKIQEKYANKEWL